MDLLMLFLVTVMANAVSSYICKWFNGDEQSDELIANTHVPLQRRGCGGTIFEHFLYKEGLCVVVIAETINFVRTV